MDLIEQLKQKADEKNRKAIAKLERRGLQFIVHFGYENAHAKLEAMNRAFERGYLYQHMKNEYGIRCQ